MTIAAVVVAGAMAAPAPAAKRHFPRTVSGTFSGEDSDFRWQGTVSLKGRREQTSYSYTGSAKYSWTLKEPTIADSCYELDCQKTCQLKPASGEFEEPVMMGISRGRTGKRGHSYWANAFGKGTKGPIQKICSDSTESSTMGGSVAGWFGGATGIGGFSNKLRNFKGSNSSFRWSFAGKK